MAKPSTDTRSTKLKRVTLAGKSKSVSFAKDRSDARAAESQEHVAAANGNSVTRSTKSEETVDLANFESDSNTTSSEQAAPTSSGNEGILAVNPNPAFVGSGEVVVRHERDAANFQLAIYIAMAHAGLVLAIAICYGFSLLLKDYWTPIQWALLVSMPLQRVQEAVVGFWMRHLQLGMVQTIFAVPAAMQKALLQTARDVRSLSVREFSGDDVAFGKLFDWLFFLATCMLLFENLGLLFSIVAGCVACVIYWSVNSIHSVVAAVLPGWLLQAQERRGSAAKVLDFTVRATRYVSGIPLKPE